MERKFFLHLSMIAAVVLLVGAGCTTKTPTPTDTVPSQPSQEQTQSASNNDAMSEGETEGVGEMPNDTVTTSADVSVDVKTDVTVTPPATDAAVKEFTISGSNMKFEPATMKVKKGDKVKITFKNVGGFHDFVLDEFKVATKRLSAGGEEVVEFTADKTGTFEYYCSVGSHRAMGMKGTLTVE